MSALNTLLNVASMAGSEVNNKIITIDKSMYNGLSYNGSESKAGIVLNNKNYILKRRKYNWNNVKCEYIASHVINVLGGNAHNTLLAVEDGEQVVLCEDFTYGTGNIKPMSELCESSMDVDITKQDYFYSDILYMIEHLTKCDVEEFAHRFLEMYVFDTILGNPDRHMGNWGILNDRMSPIFDNGASLFPRADINLMSVEWMEEHIKEFPNSKMMFGSTRKRSSYYDVWNSGLLPDYVIDYANRLNISKAVDYIMTEDNLSDKEKHFYATVVFNRYNCIINGGVDVCLM